MRLLNDEENPYLDKTGRIDNEHNMEFQLFKEGNKAQRQLDLKWIIEWLEENCNHIGTPLQTTKVEFTGYVAWMNEDAFKSLKQLAEGRTVEE